MYLIVGTSDFFGEYFYADNLIQAKEKALGLKWYRIFEAKEIESNVAEENKSFI